MKYAILVVLALFMFVATPAQAKNDPLFIQGSAVGDHYTNPDTISSSRSSDFKSGTYRAEIIVKLNAKGRALYRDYLKTDKDVILVMYPAVLEINNYSHYTMKTPVIYGYTSDNQVVTLQDGSVKNIDFDEFWLNEWFKIMDVCRERK